MIMGTVLVIEKVPREDKDGRHAMGRWWMDGIEEARALILGMYARATICSGFDSRIGLPGRLATPFQCR